MSIDTGHLSGEPEDDAGIVPSTKTNNFELTLDDIVENPARALTLRPSEAARLLLLAVAAIAALSAATVPVMQKEPKESSNGQSDEVWLTTEEVVERWPVFTARWLYTHKVPFVRHLSRRKNVYSARGIQEWLASGQNNFVLRNEGVKPQKRNGYDALSGVTEN